MGDLTSPSLLGLVAFTDYGMIPFGFAENLSANANMNSEELRGFGDFWTREVVPHGGGFQGSFGHAIMLSLPLSRMGILPTKENYAILQPFNLFLPSLGTGKMYLALYQCRLRTYNRNIALNRAPRGQASFLCLNVVDGWQIDGEAPGLPAE